MEISKCYKTGFPRTHLPPTPYPCPQKHLPHTTGQLLGCVYVLSLIPELQTSTLTRFNPESDYFISGHFSE